MGCSYAIETDEYHGFECPVSGGACMYRGIKCRKYICCQKWQPS